MLHVLKCKIILDSPDWALTQVLDRIGSRHSIWSTEPLRVSITSVCLTGKEDIDLPWFGRVLCSGEITCIGLAVVSPRQTSIYVKSYLCSRYMKSVCYHALRTVSENAYVKCGLWNRVASILPPHLLLTVWLWTWYFIHFYSNRP